MSVKDYDIDADLNLSIAGISVAEGCAPGGINDAIRQLMADVKEESEAQTEALRATVAKYLPLTGGDLSGSVRLSAGRISRTGDSGTMIVNGGTGYADGASLYLQGVNSADTVSYIRVVAPKGDGTLTASVLELTPGGDARWNGDAVITAAGGTVTGALTLAGSGSGGALNASDSGTLRICGGATINSGPRIDLQGANLSSGTPGVISLVARDGSGTRSDMVLKPDGSATWGGKSLLTSAGGTVEASLEHTTPLSARRNVDSSYLQFSGASTFGAGAGITFYGNGASSNAGNFSVVARTAAGASMNLVGSVTDGLRWGGKALATYDLAGRVTQLYNSASGLDSGDITLSQPYTNFEALIVLYGADDTGWSLSTALVSVWELQQRKAKGSNSFMLLDVGRDWALKPSSTATKLVFEGDYDETRIYTIWGVK